MHQGISRFRKMAVAAAATVATTAGLLPLAATGAGAAANFDLTRLAGANRYDTAEEISKASFPTATDVIVTTGENFPDALSGNYLAGARSAPILLTTRNSVPAETQAEVNRLNPQRLWVLGGTDAVGAGGVPSTTGTVNRVAGATRYETAVAAGSTGTVGTVGGKPTAIIATGDKFADALSAGPGAYAGNFPLYLTPGAPATALHPATKSALTSRGITNVILMGGTAAISAAVQSELQGMGITVTRVEGADRTETARNFAEWLLANLGFVNTHMNVARGDLFPDALAGGPHAGKEKAPILLTWTPQEASPGNNANLGALKYAADHKATLTSGHIFGGILAVSEAAEQAIEAAGGRTTGGGSTATTRPELTAASVIGTVTSGINAGTTIRYVFDEAVNPASAVAGNFLAYDAAGTQYVGDAVTSVSGDSNAVDVRFTDAALTNAGTAAGLTLATVDHGAINDLTGSTSPNAIGDAPLNQQSGTTLPAGVTSAPDLTAVQNFRAATATQTFVDFVFDETVINVNDTTGFHLVGLNNDEVVCTYDSGELSSTITVVCTNADLQDIASANTTITPAMIARGYVLAGTVDDGASDNPLQAADVSNAGNTGDPDLVSATFQLTATVGTTPVDQAILVFDQPVQAGSDVFWAYYANGDEEQATDAEYSATTPNQVRLTFEDGELVGAVGVSADEGAVLALGGAEPDDPNQEDEVGVSGTTGTTTASRTAGPDLISVTRALARDIFGNLSGGSTVTYAFDEDVTAATPTDFYAYLADGTLLVGATCVVGSTDATDHTVTCTAYDVGTAGGTDASDTVENSIVAGAVDDGAVTAEDAGVSNPEGYEVATTA